MASRKVLVVDDSEICREFVKMALEDRGYNVVGLESPLGFSRALFEERPDLALIDVTMPALRGDKLVELAMKTSRHKCAIVLYSDRPEPELDSLARACGATGFICKNGSEDLLAASVQKFIDGGKPN
ncbi:MAG: response regulator [Myxococcota bacterium]